MRGFILSLIPYPIILDIVFLISDIYIIRDFYKAK